MTEAKKINSEMDLEGGLLEHKDKLAFLENALTAPGSFEITDDGRHGLAMILWNLHEEAEQMYEFTADYGRYKRGRTLLNTTRGRLLHALAEGEQLTKEEMKELSDDLDEAMDALGLKGGG